MAHVVLDASALLAFLSGEAGAEVVANAITDSSISVVNVSEVMAKFMDRGAPPEAVREILAALPVTVVAADEALALRAGTLRAQTKTLGLSLGDRFCLALTERERVAVLTADRAWQNVSLGIDIVLIR